MIAWVKKFFNSNANASEASRLTFFTDIEIELVIPKLMAYAAAVAQCKNVVWLMSSKYREMKSQRVSATNLESDKLALEHFRLQSLKPIAEDELNTRLLPFINDLTQAATYRSQAQAPDILLPIVSSKTREVIAYLLLIEVTTENIKSFCLSMESDLKMFSRHIGFSIDHWEARRQTFHDDLTGLFNQKFMAMALENEIYRSEREQLKFSVLFMDIDYFKSINDTKGHTVGSQLLAEIGHLMKHNLRKNDYAFRYGGDEYVVILPATATAGAQKAAERIRQLVERTDFVIDGEHVKLTLSIGLSTFPDHAKTHKDIIKLADEAMYCGKHKSRNVVIVAS